MKIKGLLNRNLTQEEIIYNKLLKEIREVDDDDLKASLTLCVENARDNKNNALFELDFLARAIEGFITENKSVYDEVDWNKFLKIVKALLPKGKDTEGYEEIKEIILDKFLDVDEVLYNDIDKMDLFSLITNRLDYARIMKLILSFEAIRDDYDKIVLLANSIAPYVDSNTLKKYVLTFINSEISDEEIYDYINGVVEECKLRVGIPMIDEKSIAVISTEVKRAQGLIRKIETMEKNIARYKSEVEAITNSGEKRLTSIVDEKVKAITRELDDYLVKLEAIMRENADKQFNQVMESAVEKIKEIRMAALEITNVTSSEMIRLRGVSDEIVQSAKTIIEDDPTVKQIIAEASKDAQVKEAIISLKKGAAVSEIPKTGEIKVSAGVINQVPAIIIPSDELPENISPFFDTRIPFNKRFDMYLEEKKRRMQGVALEDRDVFHSRMDQVAKCIMEDDWVYCWGPSGTGKSETIKLIGEIFGVDIIKAEKIDDKYDITSFIDPQGNFRPNELYYATTQGKIIQYDEFDNGISDNQVPLNPFYDESLRLLRKPNKPAFVEFAKTVRVRLHPNFRIVCTGNTKGLGEDDNHNARSKIDEAVLQRMTHIFYDYDGTLEEQIAGKYINWLKFVRNFRKACMEWAKREGSGFAQGNITTRDFAAITRYAEHESKTIQELMEEKFIQIKDEQYIGFLVHKLLSMYDMNDSDLAKFKYPRTIGQMNDKDIAKAFVLEAKKRVA